MIPTQPIIRYILERMYHFRLYKIRKSEWRKRIGRSWVAHGSADEFIRAWEYLQAKGLIK